MKINKNKFPKNLGRNAPIPEDTFYAKTRN